MLAYWRQPVDKPLGAEQLSQADPATTVATMPSGQAVVGQGNIKTEDRRTEVCGVGSVELDLTESVAPFNYVGRLTANSKSRWQTAMVESDDNLQRAAGLLIKSQGWNYDAVTGMPARTEDAGLARDELVQMAAGLQDVPIYAMALRACDQADVPEQGTACDQISLAQWAKLDPDNAAPWLAMAAAAHAGKDRVAETDAVRHAVKAQSIDFYSDSVLTYANAAMPAATTDLEQAAFFDDLIGHLGSFGHAHGFVNSQYCTLDSIQQPSVRRQCEALAELFADHGRNTLDTSTAAKVGLALGWPADRITSMQEENLAIYRVESHSEKNPWNCENVKAVEQFAALQGHSGEVAAGRMAIKRSGKSIKELAQEQIESIKAPVISHY
jgi:hypothetical protein